MSLTTCGGYKTILISICEYISNHQITQTGLQYSFQLSDVGKIGVGKHIGSFQIGQYSALAKLSYLNLILYLGVCIWYLRACIWNFRVGIWYLVGQHCIG